MFKKTFQYKQNLLMGGLLLVGISAAGATVKKSSPPTSMGQIAAQSNEVHSAKKVPIKNSGTSRKKSKGPILAVAKMSGEESREERLKRARERIRTLEIKRSSESKLHLLSKKNELSTQERKTMVKGSPSLPKGNPIKAAPPLKIQVPSRGAEEGKLVAHGGMGSQSTRGKGQGFFSSSSVEPIKKLSYVTPLSRSLADSLPLSRISFAAREPLMQSRGGSFIPLSFVSSPSSSQWMSGTEDAEERFSPSMAPDVVEPDVTERETSEIPESGPAVSNPSPFERCGGNLPAISEEDEDSESSSQEDIPGMPPLPVSEEYEKLGYFSDIKGKPLLPEAAQDERDAYAYFLKEQLSSVGHRVQQQPRSLTSGAPGPQGSIRRLKSPDRVRAKSQEARAVTSTEPLFPPVRPNTLDLGSSIFEERSLFQNSRLLDSLQLIFGPLKDPFFPGSLVPSPESPFSRFLKGTQDLTVAIPGKIGSVIPTKVKSVAGAIGTGAMNTAEYGIINTIFEGVVITTVGTKNAIVWAGVGVKDFTVFGVTKTRNALGIAATGIKDGAIGLKNGAVSMTIGTKNAIVWAGVGVKDFTVTRYNTTKEGVGSIAGGIKNKANRISDFLASWWSSAEAKPQNTRKQGKETKKNQEGDAQAINQRNVNPPKKMNPDIPPPPLVHAEEKPVVIPSLPFRAWQGTKTAFSYLNPFSYMSAKKEVIGEKTPERPKMIATVLKGKRTEIPFAEFAKSVKKDKSYIEKRNKEAEKYMKKHPAYRIDKIDPSLFD